MNAMHALKLERPATVAAATALLAMPGARALGGGTDLLPNLRRGIGEPMLLVALDGIAALDELACGAEGLVIGAGVTLDRLATAESVDAGYAAIAQAARAVAGPQHRNAATVGGNLCLDTRCVFYNQSEWWRQANGWCLKRGGSVCHVAPQGTRCHAAFSGDLAPALIALDAEVECVSTRGARRMPLHELYRDDGSAHLTLQPGELVMRVCVPRAPERRSAYRKARVRAAMDFPLAGVAMALTMQGPRIARLRIALTGTNPHPLALAGIDALENRIVDAETLASLAKMVARQVSPMRTTAMASNYRRQVASALAQRLLRELAG